MSQTSIIAGALIVAFIIFVTVKGELPAYLGILGLGNDVPAAGSGATATAGNSFTSSGTRTGTPTVSGSIGGVTVAGNGGGISIGGNVGGVQIGGAIPI